jgi:hypothetical protein
LRQSVFTNALFATTTTTFEYDPLGRLSHIDPDGTPDSADDESGGVLRDIGTSNASAALLSGTDDLAAGGRPELARLAQNQMRYSGAFGDVIGGVAGTNPYLPSWPDASAACGSGGGCR